MLLLLSSLPLDNYAAWISLYYRFFLFLLCPDGVVEIVKKSNTGKDKRRGAKESKCERHTPALRESRALYKRKSTRESRTSKAKRKKNKRDAQHFSSRRGSEREKKKKK